MSEEKTEDEQGPRLACIMHPDRPAEFAFDISRTIAEFGQVRFGLCKFCKFKKDNDFKFKVKIMNQINGVLLAQREKDKNEQNRNPLS